MILMKKLHLYVFLVLMERRSLKVEVTDPKALPSKNTVKKELKSKTF